jgi:ribonuclease HI
MFDENVLNIYTDGSSKAKPRRGGIGIRFVYIDGSGNEAFEDFTSLGFQSATSNEMELTACIVALKNIDKYLQLQEFKKIIIFTDSAYIVNNIYNAKYIWPKKKWVKSGGAPVLNVPLWKDLIKYIGKTGKRVEFKKVQGHSTDLHNIAVDKQAKQSASIPHNKPISVHIVRRKTSSKHTQSGSIKPLGQKISLRIVDGTYLREQKHYRYRCEVVTKRSPYVGNIDFICSYEILKEGHTYFVMMNTSIENPWIVKVFWEIRNKT